MTCELIRLKLANVTTILPHKLAGQSSGVTDEQFELLNAVDRYITDNARPPAWSDISGMTGISRSTVRDRVRRLVRSGHLASRPGFHRSLAITSVGKRAVRLHRLNQQN